MKLLIRNKCVISDCIYTSRAHFCRLYTLSNLSLTMMNGIKLIMYLYKSFKFITLTNFCYIEH